MVEEKILTCSEEKALRFQAEAAAQALVRERIGNAKKMKDDGFSVEQIIRYTGLTREEAESL